MKTILVITFLCIHEAASNYCYWNTGCPYKYFSTETAYNSVRGDIRDSVIKLTGCNPVSIWGMYRHGKRKPSSHFSEKIKAALPIRNYVVESYENGHSSLCAQDVDNLRDWKFDSKFFDGVIDITEEGRQEMTRIGNRLKETFPSLLDHLPKGSYKFRSAKGIWIEKSIESLVSGLGVPNLIIDEAKPGLDVMNPYSTCGAYQKNVKSNPAVYVESAKYLKNSEYLATKDRIQRRSGIEYSLTDENVTALYDLCRYTWSAVDRKSSPWCALFTKDDLEVLEYEQDLRHYYRNSYGTAVNEVFGKVPLGDLFTNFESVTKGGGNKIVAYVTHSTMLDQMYTALGLFKDSNPLTGANRDRDRKWRTSKISVFSANLVAVLNRCVKEGSSEYNVVFYLNEEPIRSICEEGVCSWEDFDAKLRPTVNTTIDFCEFTSKHY
ncbi:multiple inositol polyphosphate phosphatase 1 [Bicyclus anynana]|uniref:Multiple inositol polyphosphate phosphatase 1 n=1 Tax=Bicyclus anynana TaxID=110368 RepID=A0A6J1MI34_BICAN|nr:multiple inositol polyphosphate phosphatase 1 [Bicyclus anynana]